MNLYDNLKGLNLNLSSWTVSFHINYYLSNWIYSYLTDKINYLLLTYWKTTVYRILIKNTFFIRIRFYEFTCGISLFAMVSREALPPGLRGQRNSGTSAIHNIYIKSIFDLKFRKVLLLIIFYNLKSKVIIESSTNDLKWEIG